MRNTIEQIRGAVGAPSLVAIGTFCVWTIAFFTSCVVEKGDCKTMPRLAVKGMSLGSDFQDASIALYAGAAMISSGLAAAATVGARALVNSGFSDVTARARALMGHVSANPQLAQEVVPLLNGAGDGIRSSANSEMDTERATSPVAPEAPQPETAINESSANASLTNGTVSTLFATVNPSNAVVVVDSEQAVARPGSR